MASIDHHHHPAVHRHTTCPTIYRCWVYRRLNVMCFAAEGRTTTNTHPIQTNSPVVANQQQTHTSSPHAHIMATKTAVMSTYSSYAAQRTYVQQITQPQHNLSCCVFCPYSYVRHLGSRTLTITLHLSVFCSLYPHLPRAAALWHVSLCHTWLLVER